MLFLSMVPLAMLLMYPVLGFRYNQVFLQELGLTATTGDSLQNAGLKARRAGQLRSEQRALLSGRNVAVKGDPPSINFDWPIKIPSFYDWWKSGVCQRIPGCELLKGKVLSEIYGYGACKANNWVHIQRTNGQFLRNTDGWGSVDIVSCTTDASGATVSPAKCTNHRTEWVLELAYDTDKNKDQDVSDTKIVPVRIKSCNTGQMENDDEYLSASYSLGTPPGYIQKNSLDLKKRELAGAWFLCYPDANKKDIYNLVYYEPWRRPNRGAVDLRCAPCLSFNTTEEDEASGMDNMKRCGWQGLFSGCPKQFYSHAGLTSGVVLPSDKLPNNAPTFTREAIEVKISGPGTFTGGIKFLLDQVTPCPTVYEGDPMSLKTLCLSSKSSQERCLMRNGLPA